MKGDDMKGGGLNCEKGLLYTPPRAARRAIPMITNEYTLIINAPAEDFAGEW